MSLRKPTQAQPISTGGDATQGSKTGASPALPQVSARHLAVISRENNEFLPAALEIIVSPASPIRIALLWFICALVTAALVWSYFSKIDIYAVAEGKIQPSGRSKIVQPLEAGKVKAVYVENGTKVRAADVLVELDPTETSAEVEAITRELDATKAELARRPVEIKAVLAGATIPPAIEFGPETHPTIRQREQAVLSADLAQIDATRQTITAQINEKAAMTSRLNLSISARDRLLDILKERMEMRQTLVSKEAGTKASVIDAAELLERALTDQAYDKGQLLESTAAIDSLQRKLQETTSQFIADQTQKIADAGRKRDHLVQDLIKAQSKNARTKLVAPIDGTVQQLGVTTIGQVVTQGQPLMTIVPQNGPIEVEALVLNRDIGFITVGQEAVIKVESFPVSYTHLDVYKRQPRWWTSFISVTSGPSAWRRSRR